MVKKILVLNMVVDSLAQGVPFGRFHTLYNINGEKKHQYKTCLLARSLKGCLLGGFTLYTRKKNIGNKHDCWLARSRGAIWEVSHFIPRKKNRENKEL